MWNISLKCCKEEEENETLFWKYNDNDNNADDSMSAWIYRVYDFSESKYSLLGKTDFICTRIWLGYLLNLVCVRFPISSYNCFAVSLWHFILFPTLIIQRIHPVHNAVKDFLLTRVVFI